MGAVRPGIANAIGAVFAAAAAIRIGVDASNVKLTVVRGLIGSRVWFT
jgi:hypothetical protein